METMNYREKKKSLKLPIFGLTTFMLVGTGVIFYGMNNEKEPVIYGNGGSLYTGEIPVVAETNALVNLKDEDVEDMFTIKKQYISDNSFEKLKCDISVPYIYIDGKELEKFNKNLENKFTKTFESFKESMKDVENEFTYRVYYEVLSNVVKNEGIISIIMTEKMVNTKTQEESLKKRYTYNIDIATGEVLEQRDVLVSVLGASYKDAIKESISTYLDNEKIQKKEDYNYAYTGFENFYIKKGKLHFIFNSRRFS